MQFPCLQRGEVHIWKLSLDRPQAAIDNDWLVMSSDEAARAGRFVFPEHRDRYIACRASLRRLLAQYLQTSPGHLAFRYNDFGKPELSTPLDGSRLRFNVSHCDNWALVAVALKQRVGIDIERLRQFDDLENVANGCFSNLELRELLSLPKLQRTEAFFNCWTRKEAFIKAWGDGISHPLSDFDVTLLPKSPARLLRIGGQRTSPTEWSLIAWQPVPDYVAAMAIDESAIRVIHIDATQ